MLRRQRRRRWRWQDKYGLNNMLSGMRRIEMDTDGRARED